jgi:hypothetical protein
MTAEIATSVAFMGEVANLYAVEKFANMRKPSACDGTIPGLSGRSLRCSLTGSVGHFSTTAIQIRRIPLEISCSGPLPGRASLVCKLIVGIDI